MFASRKANPKSLPPLMSRKTQPGLPASLRPAQEQHVPKGSASEQARPWNFGQVPVLPSPHPKPIQVSDLLSASRVYGRPQQHAESSKGDNALEREANWIAEHITAMSAPASRAPLAPLQVTRLPYRSANAPPATDEALRSPGQPLPKALRDYYEPRFGFDFSQVRIHSDSLATESARAANAHAYTLGNTIAFDSGRFAPETGDGRRLLAHELTHVLQQAGGPASIQCQQASDDASRRDVNAAIRHGQLMAKRIRTHTKLSKEARAKIIRELAYFEDRAKDAYVKELRPALLEVKEIGVLGDQEQAPRGNPGDPAAFLNRMLGQPTYIDNHIKTVEYFTAEQARIHYYDGGVLLLGLVPKWMKPPFVEVDYHTPRDGFFPLFDRKGGVSFILKSDLANVPPSLPFAELQKRYGRSVDFVFDGESGRTLPSRVNAMTAPTLCKVLLESEGKFEDQVQFAMKFALGVARVLQVQTLNPLMGAAGSIAADAAGGTAARAGASDAAKLGAQDTAGVAAKAAGEALSAGKMGEIIGWGTGQTAEAVAVTKGVTQTLTTDAIKTMIGKGLTKEFVVEQLANYTAAIAKGGAKLKNVQLFARQELMAKLLELWP